MTAYHRPVLLNEAIEGLNIKASGIYVDVTFGGGGHSGEILRRLGKKGKLYVFDQDEAAAARVPDDKRILFTRGNFRFLDNYLRFYRIDKIDGILADLGVSSHHFDSAERGFSYRFDAPLDMRMNSRSSITAARVVNEYSIAELERVLKVYGEIQHAGKVADSIITARENGIISTTGQLVGIIQRHIPLRQSNQFLSQVFQALRIEVNREMENLEILLKQSVAWLRPGGRLVVISYHSLEDRLVKNFIRSGNPEGLTRKDVFGHFEVPLKALRQKPVVPTDEEIQSNVRARSAKLRVAEKTGLT
jgi:16S rRNA (cytosine1402-N4)-methyltransferase